MKSSWRFIVPFVLLLGLVILPGAAYGLPAPPTASAASTWQANVHAHGTVDANGNFGTAIITWSPASEFPISAYQVVTYKQIGANSMNWQLVNYSSSGVHVDYTSLGYAVVHGLTAGTTYRFQVQLWNGSQLLALAWQTMPPAVQAHPGQPGWFIPVSWAPSNPTGMQPQSANAAATLTWNPIQVTGTNLAYYTDHYFIEVYAPDGTLVQYLDSIAASPASISSLTNGVTYQFVLHTVARNGMMSTGVSRYVTPQASPAIAVDRLVIQPGDHVAVTGTGFSPNTAVMVSMGKINTTASGNYGTIASNAQGGFTIFVTLSQFPDGSALQPGMINLVAHTASWTEKASVQLQVAPPARAPDAPTNVSAQAGNGQATVTWNPPYNGGQTIISYRVTTYLANTSTVISTLNVAGTSTSAIVTSLTNGTTYSFTVQAGNGIGMSGAAVRSNLVTPMTVPGVVRNLTVTGGDQSATVKWDAPASTGGSAITGYQVTANDGVHAPVVVTVGTNSATFTGLTNGTAYSIAVEPINAAGHGQAVTATAKSVFQNLVGEWIC